MNSDRSRTARNVLLCLALLLPVACGGTRFNYRPASEIPDGPGMFSGSDGAFTLYSSSRTADEQRENSNSAENPPAVGAELHEFQEFQEFRRWKVTHEGGPEFQEFQDWREWKAYRRWKEGKR